MFGQRKIWQLLTKNCRHSEKKRAVVSNNFYVLLAGIESNGPQLLMKMAAGRFIANNRSATHAATVGKLFSTFSLKDHPKIWASSFSQRCQMPPGILKVFEY
jgi:hypothetical protein